MKFKHFKEQFQNEKENGNKKKQFQRFNERKDFKRFVNCRSNKIDIDAIRDAEDESYERGGR